MGRQVVRWYHHERRSTIGHGRTSNEIGNTAERSRFDGCRERRNLRSNHLLQAQLRGVQAKTAISQPGDSLEREADRVADSVMRAPHSPVRVESSSGVTPAVQRMCSACEEEIHRKAATGPSARPSGSFVTRRARDGLYPAPSAASSSRAFITTSAT